MGLMVHSPLLYNDTGSLDNSWISRSTIQKHEARIHKEIADKKLTEELRMEGLNGAPLKVIDANSQERVVSAVT